MSDRRGASADLHLRVAGLCFMVLFLEGYDVSAMSYAQPSLMDAWHVRGAQFTTAVTVGGVGMLFGSLCAGQLGDRIGRKPVLIACLATFGLFSLLTARSGGLSMLAALRFMVGIGIGGGLPLTITLATDHASPRTPRRFVVLMSAGLSVGSTSGGFIAGQFVTHFSWEAIFIVGGLLPLLLIPVLAAFLPGDRGLDGETMSARRASPFELFSHGLLLRTIVLWVVSFCQLFGNFLIVLWLPTMLHTEGLAPADAIFVATIYALGSILGALITAPIVDRLGIERVMAGVLCIGAGCLLLVGSIALPFVALCIVAGGMGVGIGGCQHAINAVTGALYPTSIRATGTGWVLGWGRVGQIVGPLAGGLLLGLGWQPRNILLAAAGPAFCVALGMAMLAYLRASEVRRAAVAASG